MTWILLRGLTREARHWGSFKNQFGKRLAPDKATALDLPGNGEFYQQPSPTSVNAMVDFGRGQLLAQGVKPPYSLLAMSLGGMVASDWAQRFPQEVDRLVLINTSVCALPTGRSLACWQRVGQTLTMQKTPSTG